MIFNDSDWSFSSLQTESERNSESGIPNGVFACFCSNPWWDISRPWPRLPQMEAKRLAEKRWQPQWLQAMATMDLFDAWVKKQSWLRRGAQVSHRCHTVTQYLCWLYNFSRLSIQAKARVRFCSNLCVNRNSCERWTFRKLNKQGIALQSALPLVSPNCRLSRLIKIPKHQLSTST